MTSQRRQIWQGVKLTLYAVSKGDVCDVAVWLESLDDAAQSAFKSRFEHLCDVGRLRSPGSWRALDKGVFEVKVHAGPGYRLYMLRDGNDFMATHGRVKPKPNRVAAEVKKARRMFDEYLKGLTNK